MLMENDMLEILQYVTSGFWVFIGCTIFGSACLLCAGWALNAMMIGIKGKKCDEVNIF